MKQNLDFRNVNTLWCSIIVETLYKLGLTTAIISPGSRSTPLTVAFAQHSDVETIPILDERSAAFFALGIAKRAGIPVALVCTSGTAGANFYPAVIEAKYSSVPLLIFTADRPPELRNCRAGQTIDQIKLYSSYPNWHVELALPSAEVEMLYYLRQNIIHAWERSLFPVAGVVHLNLPFREPLAPIEQPEIKQLESTVLERQLLSNISSNLLLTTSSSPDASSLVQNWQKYQRGIIIAGVDRAHRPEKYCQAIAKISHLLKFPVLAEALSPVRNYAHLNSYLVSTYDLILRNSKLAKDLTPEIVILIGELPTSKELRSWLSIIKPKTYIIDDSYNNLDALHGNSITIRTTIENIVNNLNKLNIYTCKARPFYSEIWLNLEGKLSNNINQKMNNIVHFFEGKVPWVLSNILPRKTPLFIANSMPVRYCEFFWQKGNREIIPYFNRGTNGIDGNLSTALGMAHHNQSSILLTGDLALLHDTNGLLNSKYFQGHLSIVLINNNGGGIFEALPISKFEPPFEDFFATPQQVDFRKLCDSYGVEYKLITSWKSLKNLLISLPTTGIRLLELKTNRKTDSLWLRENLPKLANYQFI